MTLQKLENGLRLAILKPIEETLNEMDYEVLHIPMDENSNSDSFRLAIPTVDEERNERTVIINVTIARKNKAGDEFDAYEEAERLKENIAAKKVKKEKKVEKEKNKKASKKESKKVVKELQDAVKECGLK